MFRAAIELNKNSSEFQVFGGPRFLLHHARSIEREYMLAGRKCNGEYPLCLPLLIIDTYRFYRKDIWLAYCQKNFLAGTFRGTR